MVQIQYLVALLLQAVVGLILVLKQERPAEVVVEVREVAQVVLVILHQHHRAKEIQAVVQQVPNLRAAAAVVLAQ
jgi:hypothetical protein